MPASVLCQYQYTSIILTTPSMSSTNLLKSSSLVKPREDTRLVEPRGDSWWYLLRYYKWPVFLARAVDPTHLQRPRLRLWLCPPPPNNSDLIRFRLRLRFTLILLRITWRHVGRTNPSSVTSCFHDRDASNVDSSAPIRPGVRTSRQSQKLRSLKLQSESAILYRLGLRLRHLPKLRTPTDSDSNFDPDSRQHCFQQYPVSSGTLL